MDTRFDEDKPIIGTKRYEPFQRMVSRAAELAIYRAKKAGLPITGVRGTDIVTEYPDGRCEIIGTVPPPVIVKKKIYRLPKN
jgi:hypothetical protein